MDNKIDLVVVGPEQPLVDGIVDYLDKYKIKVFGPNKSASQLEGSKIFTKKLCEKYNIPTAKFGIFSDSNKAIKFVKDNNLYIAELEIDDFPDKDIDTPSDNNNQLGLIGITSLFIFGAIVAGSNGSKSNNTAVQNTNSETKISGNVDAGPVLADSGLLVILYIGSI